MLRIKPNNSKDLLINEDINFPQSKLVRVVGPDGEQIGQMPFGNALNSAYDRDLDLCLIAAQADPPVCRIMDYGKFRFDRDKRDKEQRKKAQTIETKEIQLSCLIDTNDFNTKANHARKFLQAGNKVRVVVKFRGRQMTHQDIGHDMLNRFREACADVGTVDKAPVLEGRFLSMFILPLKQTAKDKAPKAPKPEPAPAPEE